MNELKPDTNDILNNDTNVTETTATTTEVIDKISAETEKQNTATQKDTYAAKKKEKEEAEKKADMAKWIMCALAAIIILLIVLLLRSCGNTSVDPTGNNVVTGIPTSSPVGPTGSGLVIDDGGDWDGDNNTNFSDQGEVEYTTVPGFTDIVVNESNKEIQLYNLKENTVYFIYTITNKDTGEKIYETKAIAPGKATKWNVYDTMGVGTYTVSIEISTYDVTTQEQCYGAKQTVKVVVQ